MMNKYVNGSAKLLNGYGSAHTEKIQRGAALFFFKVLSCFFLTLIVLPNNSLAQSEAERPLVVATASMFKDMAEVIGGNLIRVESIVSIGGDPHTYEPTPTDAQLVARADLVLRNGLTFEGWIDELVDNSGFTGRITTITEGIAAIESDEYANSADPHAWMSGKNGLIYLRNIRDALVTLAPQYAEEFNFNYGIYRQQLLDTDQEIAQMLRTIPKNRRILITSHDAFRYFGERYGMRVEAVLGTSTDADVQTSDIRRLNRILQETGVPAVFIESTLNPKVLQIIANDNEVIIGGSLYADSLGEPTGPAGTYLDMLRHNAQTIVEGLTLNKVGNSSDLSPDKNGEKSWLFGIIIALMLGSFLFMVRQLNRGI
ncbi:MAG: zinc ABC transporter substrate-binding protein [Bacteroidota bacterium]